MRNHALEAVRSYYQKILPFYEEETEERPDLGFWRAICAEQKPAWVLELGAGTGRVTAALASQARGAERIVALDLSHDMLRRAAQRLAGKPDVYLVAADMRRFALGRSFDLIVAPNDPFSHLTHRRERQMAMRLIGHHLAPGGRVVIEGLYRPERKRIEMPERREGDVTVRECWTPLATDNRWHARYSYARGAERADAEFMARSWDPAEPAALFDPCGLEATAVWGDFNRAPFTPDSERMIVVAARQADRSRATLPDEPLE